MSNKVRLSEEKAARAMVDAARLADELRCEQLSTALNNFGHNLDEMASKARKHEDTAQLAMIEEHEHEHTGIVRENLIIKFFGCFI